MVAGGTCLKSKYKISTAMIQGEILEAHFFMLMLLISWDRKKVHAEKRTFNHL